MAQLDRPLEKPKVELPFLTSASSRVIVAWNTHQLTSIGNQAAEEIARMLSQMKIIAQGSAGEYNHYHVDLPSLWYMALADMK